jgi:hypothetical protein
MCDFSEYELYETLEIPQPAPTRRAEPRRPRAEEPAPALPTPVASERKAPALVAAEA